VPGEGVLPGCVSHLHATEEKSSTAWRLSGEVNVKGGDGDAHDEQPLSQFCRGGQKALAVKRHRAKPQRLA
jgi:hypothetical protein